MGRRGNQGRKTEKSSGGKNAPSETQKRCLTKKGRGGLRKGKRRMRGDIVMSRKKPQGNRNSSKSETERKEDTGDRMNRITIIGPYRRGKRSLSTGAPEPRGEWKEGKR